MHPNSPPAPELVLTQLGLNTRETVIVGERSFLIERPAQSDKLLEIPEVFVAHDADQYVPYWADLWPGARMLAKAILQESWQPGAEALEIGCGLGLAGIAALSAGLKVTLSDYDPCALHFAALNARLNGFEEVRSLKAAPPVDRSLRATATAGFRILQLDWRHPPADLRAPVLFGSDLIYELRNVEPLIAFIRQVLVPGGVCLLTDQDRIPSHAFKQTLDHERLSYSTRIIRAGEPGGRRLKGTLYRITR